MDVIGGLTAAKLALDLVKDLREIDKSVDEATFKLKLADLTSALADTKVALSDAKLSLQDKDAEIVRLARELTDAKFGEICPMCRDGRMKLYRTAGHDSHGLSNFGVEDWYYSCEKGECGFQQTRIHDPHGAVSATARK